MSIPDRYRRGREAEHAVAGFVERAGMTVLGRNVRVGHLELDLVARDGDAMVVVEVRTRGRGAWQSAFDSLGPDKLRRVRRAAAILWLRHWRRQKGIERVRFDVAAVDVDRRVPTVEYVRAAF